MVLSASRTTARAGLLAAALGVAAWTAAPAQTPSGGWTTGRGQLPSSTRYTGTYPNYASQQPRAGWLGIGLSCSGCELHSTGKTVMRWVFATPPEIYSVDRNGPADRAGLRRGDTLLSIDGQALTSAAGGEAFANLQPDTRIRLGYLRDGRERTVNVTPVVSPTYRQLVTRDSQLHEMARNLSRGATEEATRAREQLSRVADDLARNRGKVLSEAALERMRTSIAEASRYLRNSPPALVAPPVPPVVAVPPVYPMLPPAGPSRLRYAGRVGNVSVEARRAGTVNVVETGDSLVVLSGGDLTVRIVADRGPARQPATGTAIRTGAGDVAYGVTGYLMNPQLAEAFEVSGGVLVLSVEPSSHADSLGIEAGDVVVELNDRPAASIATVTIPRGGVRVQPGAQTAEVVRQGERVMLTMPAVVRPRPAIPAPSRRPTRPAPTPNPV